MKQLSTSKAHESLIHLVNYILSGDHRVGWWSAVSTGGNIQPTEGNFLKVNWRQTKNWIRISCLERQIETTPGKTKNEVSTTLPYSKPLKGYMPDKTTSPNTRLAKRGGYE